MKKILLSVCTIVMLVSCNNKNEKKVLVINRGNATVDVATKKVIIKEGSGNEEHEMLYNTSDKIVIDVNNNNTTFQASIPENGYYIINALNDTIIGSLQNYIDPSKPATDGVFISQEMIQKSIDSLTALTEGKNISEANHNFFIPPFTTVKITTNTKAIIIAPYHNIRSLEQDGDKIPEVYRFFSINEIREKIEKQKALTKKN